MEHKHHSLKKEIVGLNRIIGQLEGIKKMINEYRDCPEILIQLKATRSAILTVEKNILSTHLKKCVVESFDNKELAMEKISEIEELFRKMQS